MCICVYVYVGRLSREKKIDVLIEAIRSIPGAYLAIIGTLVMVMLYL